MGFQRAQRLTPDGIVDEDTLVRLATITRDVTEPSLSTGPR